MKTRKALLIFVLIFIVLGFLQADFFSILMGISPDLIFVFAVIITLCIDDFLSVVFLTSCSAAAESLFSLVPMWLVVLWTLLVCCAVWQLKGSRFSSSVWAPYCFVFAGSIIQGGIIVLYLVSAKALINDSLFVLFIVSLLNVLFTYPVFKFVNSFAIQKAVWFNRG